MLKICEKNSSVNLRLEIFVVAFRARKLFGTFEKRAPGACFSKATKTFRAWEAIFNCLYIENKEVYGHETLHEGKLCSY